MDDRAGTVLGPGPGRAIVGGNHCTSTSNTNDTNPARTPRSTEPWRATPNLTDAREPLTRRVPTTAEAPGGSSLRRRSRRKRLSAKAPTKDGATLALTASQRKRRRPLRAEPAHGKTPTRHERTNAYTGRHHAHARRNSKAGGSRNCSGASSRKTGTTSKLDKHLKPENGEP